MYVCEHARVCECEMFCCHCLEVKKEKKKEEKLSIIRACMLMCVYVCVCTVAVFSQNFDLFLKGIHDFFELRRASRFG